MNSARSRFIRAASARTSASIVARFGRALTGIFRPVCGATVSVRRFSFESCGAGSLLDMSPARFQLPNRRSMRLISGDTDWLAHSCIETSAGHSCICILSKAGPACVEWSHVFRSGAPRVDVRQVRRNPDGVRNPRSTSGQAVVFRRDEERANAVIRRARERMRHTFSTQLSL